MTTSTPQAARRLPAVHPDVAKMLTALVLFKPVLGSINVVLYNYVIECCEFEDFWRIFYSLLE
jgi:hypothetical protein